MRLPWMPLYCDDLIGSTADMSAEEFGGYMRLLCHIWTRGPVEMDDAVCCRIAGVKLRVWRRIRKRFDVCKRSDGTAGLSHPRLEREKIARTLAHEERVASGQKGALARWKRGSADGSAIGSASGKANGNQNQKRKTTSSVDSTMSERSDSRAAPAIEVAGLPRLVAVASVDDNEQAERNRQFIRDYRAGAPK